MAEEEHKALIFVRKEEEKKISQMSAWECHQEISRLHYIPENWTVRIRFRAKKEEDGYTIYNFTPTGKIFE